MRASIFIAAWLLLAGLPGTALAASDAATASVFVPTFVDPQHHVDKPDLGAGRTIRFLTTDDYPPFNFTTPDGGLAGFNVDLARALCDELKVACSIQVRSWSDLVTALNGNSGDAVIAALAINDRSRAEVAFTTPTMRPPARFTARAQNPPAEIASTTIGGRTVGVQAGTAHAAYLKAFFPLATIRTFPDPESLRNALKAGQVDLMFADGVATALWLNGTEANGCCVFVGGPYTESRYFGEGSGIAVRRGDDILRNALDYGLAQLAASGRMADLYLKYFPIDPY